MENNEYSYFTADEIKKMDDSDRINNVFTESEIKELDDEFDSYLLEPYDNELAGARFVFKSTRRVMYFVTSSGICEIIKLGDGFISTAENTFDTNELSELSSRFKGCKIVIELSHWNTGFNKATLGSGKEFWYIKMDGIITVINIIKPNIGRVNTGMKFDDDKLLCMAMPAQEYKQVLEVLTNGAKKYKIDNWKHVDDARNRYMNGLERHFIDYKEAIQTGNEELKFDNGEGGMGTHHLANLICNAIFLMYFDNNNID